jgi:uncharacterized membrane protein
MAGTDTTDSPTSGRPERSSGAGASPPPWPSQRIVALDVARFLAILGMIAQHLLPVGTPNAVVAVSSGFPSTLFAVLGGVSAVIATRRYRHAGRPRAARAAIVVRGLTVALIGVILLVAPHLAIPVLFPYGISLVLVAFLMRLRTAILVGVTVVLAAGGPHLILWAASAGQITGPVVAVVAGVLLGGHYAVVTWLTYMLIGVCVGKALDDGHPRPRVIGGMAAVGAAMLAVGALADALSRSAVVRVVSGGGVSRDAAQRIATESHAGVPVGTGWIAVVNAAPHSGTTADILRTGGAAMLVIAVLLAVTARRGERLPVLVRPIGSAGSAPLTIYTLHMAVTGIGVVVAGDATGTNSPWWLQGGAAFALHMAGILTIGIILMILDKRGPLETFVSAAARRGSALARDR